MHLGKKENRETILPTKHILESLKESKYSVEDIIGILPEAAFVVNAEGIIIAWNNALEVMTGVKADDILGKGNCEHSIPFYGCRRPVLINMILNPIESIEQTYPKFERIEENVFGENFCPAVGNAGAYLSASAAPIYNSAGKVIGAIEIIKDETQKRRNVEDLIRIKKAVESASNAIWLSDVKAQYLTYCNEAFEKLFKYSIEELNAKGGCLALFQELFYAEAVYATLKTGQPWSGELDMLTSEGKTVPIFLYADIVKDEAGKTIAYLGIITDITEKRKRSEELFESRQLMSKIIEFLPDATFAIDVEAKVITWNKAIEEMTGVKAEQMLGKGDYEYAIPFYGHRRPVLIDLVLDTDWENNENYKLISRQNGVLIAETTSPFFNGKEAVLWGKATILYDSRGTVLGAIESIRDVTEHIQAEKRLQSSYEELQLTLAGTVDALSATTEKKDLYIAGHQERVAKLACAIGKELGLTDEQVDTIRTAAIIHDIGKIHLPTEILSKPGRISDIERAMIMTHSQVGYEIVNTIPFKHRIAEIVLQHHERVDGSGYPLGLNGDSILLEAHIIAVADVVEAMAMHRPYRPALGIDAALREIIENCGILYNDKVVEACLAVFAKGYEFSI